jgi:hypothetical protein
MTVPEAQPQGGELLPCPFDGRAPALKKVPTRSLNPVDDYWIIACEVYLNGGVPLVDDGCGIYQQGRTREEVIRRWNTRADLPRATAVDDAAIRQALRPIRGCATDDQYVDVFERVTALLTTSRPDGETTVEAWQPIETAPRDGSPILIANDRLVHEVRWMISADKGAPDGGWFVGGYNGWRLTWKPSYWRQLPSPYRATPILATVESMLAELRELFPLPHDLRVALSDYGRIINAEVYRDARLIAKGKTLADCMAQVRAAAQTKAESGGEEG